MARCGVSVAAPVGFWAPTGLKGVRFAYRCPRIVLLLPEPRVGLYMAIIGGLVGLRLGPISRLQLEDICPFSVHSEPSMGTASTLGLGSPNLLLHPLLRLPHLGEVGLLAWPIASGLLRHLAKARALCILQWFLLP